MKSNEERLHFVIRFAEMKLDLLREGDWLNLKEDILDFLDWPSLRQAEITREAVAALQDEVAGVLHDIVGRPPPASSKVGQAYKRPRLKKARIVGTGNDQVFSVDVKTVERLAFDCSTRGELWFSVTADLRDSFFFALGVTLSKAALSRLRQCSTCSRLFYAEHGRQQSCSPRCATKQRVKRFRRQEAGEESAVIVSPIPYSGRQKTKQKAPQGREEA